MHIDKGTYLYSVKTPDNSLSASDFALFSLGLMAHVLILARSVAVTLSG